MEGADGGALLDDADDAQGSPAVAEFPAQQALARLRPAAGQLAAVRLAPGPRLPAQGQGGAAPDDTLRAKGPEAFGALEGGDLRRVEQHLGGAAQLQQVAALVVDEQQSGLAVDGDVAQGVEEQVAIEVGNGQHALGIHPDEARLAATVGNVHPAPSVLLGIGGDEEGIGPFDQLACRLIQRLEGFDGRSGRLIRWLVGLQVAQLDVARAVAETLIHGQPQAPGRQLDLAIDAVAPPSVQLDAQQSHGGAIRQAGAGRIPCR